MERRWNLRKTTTLDVMIHYKGLGLVRGQAQNIGLDGMLIYLGQIALPLHAKVELSFKLDFNGNKQLHRITGYIAHISTKGVGVIFDTVDKQVHLALRLLLYGK